VNDFVTVVETVSDNICGHGGNFAGTGAEIFEAVHY
jgi:hypothetical protein